MTFTRKELPHYGSVVSYTVHGGNKRNSCTGDTRESVVRYDCPSLARLAFYHETVKNLFIVL